MILQNVVDAARYSELSSVALKDNNAAIISFINLGMLELYKRFPLSFNEYTIDVTDGAVMYSLPSDYLYVLGVYENVATTTNPDNIKELVINDNGNQDAVFFPNHKTIQVPVVEGRIAVSVIYVTKPQSYTINDLNEELDLPESLIDCLLHYIGYKAHLGVRGDGQAENNAHYLRFERSCDKARELGVANQVESWRMAARFTDRGFA